MEKAQKGDLIRIISTEDTHGKYENGDILEVSRRFKPFDDGVVATNGAQIFDSEYVIHRKVGEEESSEEVARGVETQQVRPDSAHYHKGSVDVWKFADENFSAEEVSGFHRINAIKYLTRYGKKGGNNRKDLEKAIVSIEKLIAIHDAKPTQY